MTWRLAPGSCLADRYDIVRSIGHGGHGVVHEAFDRAAGRAVAIKTLDRGDHRGVGDLKREFRALADLHHPNLVGLHDLVASDGRWFFTMELVEGGDFLAHVRAEGAGAPARALDPRAQPGRHQRFPVRARVPGQR